MSEARGKIQRTIIDLIFGPDGERGYAWPLDWLCAEVYGKGDGWPLAQEVAIGRAISRMHLPGTWVFKRVPGDGPSGGRWWLYDECSPASVEMAFSNSYYGGTLEREVALTVERAVRWRDSAEIKRLDIEIEKFEAGMALSKALDALRRKKRLRLKPGQTLREAVEERDRQREERLAALRRRKAELAGAPDPA